MASGAGPVVFSGPLFHPSSSLAGRGPRVRDSSGNMARQKPPAATAVDFANDGDRSVICSVRNSSKACAPLPLFTRCRDFLWYYYRKTMLRLTLGWTVGATSRSNQSSTSNLPRDSVCNASLRPS